MMSHKQSLKTRALIAGAAASIVLGLTAAGASATTIHTSSFIGTVTNFDGFESLPASTNLPQQTVYSEGGIDVEYVGTGNGSWTTSPIAGKEGQRSWYQAWGGFGYTAIKLSSGADFHAIQFLAGSGWFPGVAPDFQFQLLLDGSVVDQGSVRFTTSDDPLRAFGFYGFSDGTFDEVRLQSLRVDGPFNTSLIEGLALDSISIGSVAVSTTPIPAALPLFLSALSGLGFAGWRRRQAKGVAA
jgi:hypothetical protein